MDLTLGCISLSALAGYILSQGHSWVWLVPLTVSIIFSLAREGKKNEDNNRRSNAY